MYIRDFGILKNQTLDEIHPGLVVIGGLNRAGKTTLMQVLRYLGYGFPKAGHLPPASSKYEVDADLRYENDFYNLKLQGYGKPELNRISGEGQLIEDYQDLYGIDGFTYRQLFTISLDELRPLEVWTKDEQERLKSILLGAGFGDLLNLPYLGDRFAKTADFIGGTKGSSNVRQFAAYHDLIKQGQDLKEEGLAQVEEYREKNVALQETEEKIKQVNEELTDLKNRVIRLDVVKNNFSNNVQLEELRKEVSEKQEDAWSDGPRLEHVERVQNLEAPYLQLQNELRERELELGLSDETVDLLLARQSELTRLGAGISGIKERIRLFETVRQDYEVNKQKLTDEIRDINADWQGQNYEKIMDIRTDSIEYNRLNEVLDEYTETKYSKDVLATELNRLRLEQEILEEHVFGPEAEKGRNSLRKALVFSVTSVSVGVLIYLFSPYLGILIGFGGIASTLMYFLFSLQKDKSNLALLRRDEERLADVKVKLKLERENLENRQASFDLWDKELRDYRKALRLDSEVSFGNLPSYLTRIKNVQGQILDLLRLQKQLSTDKSYLDSEYTGYRKFLTELSSEQGAQGEGWDWIFADLRTWQENLEKARKVRGLQQRIHETEQEIIKILELDPTFSPEDTVLVEAINTFVAKSQRGLEFAAIRGKYEELERTIVSSLSSDTVKEAFADENILEAFQEDCHRYSSSESVEQAYLSSITERTDKTEALERLKSERQSLKDALKALATQEKLVHGQQLITNGRTALRDLAEDYAKNRIAELLLQKVEQNMLQGMKDNIMDNAGQVFKQMTGGDYKGVFPSEPLLETDFQAILQDGIESQGVNMLSRGTKEQLYLAVRLGRIMDVKPFLPIIIDDSFANFDNRHLSQSINILSELAKTHQIFILTCHRNLLENIARTETDIQYWKLKQGEISKSEYSELLRHLS